MSNLVNLEKLDLGRTKVSDISPLKDLVNLKQLTLSEFDWISDISPLSTLVNLKELDLGYYCRGLSDLSPLDKLRKAGLRII